MTKKSAKTPAKSSTPAKKTASKKTAAPVEAAEPKRGSNKIAKTQLVDQVAQKSGLTKKQAGEAVEAVMQSLVSTLQGGQSVGLPGLGTFSVKATAARTGVRPGTSERIQIPAGKKVAFKVASTLKGSINGDGEA